MQPYNYLLFRIYKFYTNIIKEKDIPLFYTSCLSTALIFFNIYTLYTYLIYRGLFIDIMPNKYYVIVPIFIIWFLNYLILVRPQRFLEYDFEMNFKGGVVVIIYLLFTIFAFIIVANLNRAKIENQKQNHVVVSPIQQKPSLEGKIRKWLNDTF